MRTSLADILRLAWTLYRHPHRKHLRIGQILVNANTRAGSPWNLFYVENETLVEQIKSVKHLWLPERTGDRT